MVVQAAPHPPLEHLHQEHPWPTGGGVGPLHSSSPSTQVPTVTHLPSSPSTWSTRNLGCSQDKPSLCLMSPPPPCTTAPTTSSTRGQVRGTSTSSPSLSFMNSGMVE